MKEQYLPPEIQAVYFAAADIIATSGWNDDVRESFGGGSFELIIQPGSTVLPQDSVTEPSVTEPTVTDPAMTQPTEPPVTDDPTTQPPATEPWQPPFEWVPGENEGEMDWGALDDQDDMPDWTDPTPPATEPVEPPTQIVDGEVWVPGENEGELDIGAFDGQ